jgi:SAM-dependent methyltransferase
MPDCLVCGSPDVATFESPQWRCRRCGFVFVQEAAAWRARDYGALYADDAGRTIDAGRRALYDAMLALVPAFGSRRSLDVGCGGGLFVRLASAAGWTATGIDPAAPADEGPARHFVRAEFPSPTPIPGAPFALVTFIGSLNYMDDPVAALRAAHGLLEPGGVVLVRVPNVAAHVFASRVAHAVGRHSRLGHWLGRGIVRHRRSFAAGTLRTALARAGFSGVRVEASLPVPGDPYDSRVRGIAAAKVVIGTLTTAVARASAQRLLLSPSLIARATRSGC